MPKRLWFGLLILFVLAALGRAYLQYQQLTIDGDLAAIVLPADWYAPVLHDPFGWAVLSRGAVYAAPNRFFAHWLLSSYFRAVPLWLQRFTTPIASVYLAISLFKLATQALLLYLLALYAGATTDLRRLAPWLLMALLVPLFQTSGYNVQMGIIDHAVTYTAFYALPMALLLLWLLPFYRAAQRGAWAPLPWYRLVLLAALAVVLALNGPVVQGTVMVLLLVIAGYWWTQRAAAPLPWQPALLLGWLGLLCLYSLYLGRYNAENLAATLSLGERYQRLPLGIFKLLTVKIGLPLLVLAVLVNARLIRRVAPSPEGQRLLTLLRWLGLFIALYLLLLPLGGYRNYRPLILRRDTALPITLGVIIGYGATTYYLLRQLPATRLRRWYVVGIGALSLLFLATDKLHIKGDNNACEQAALAELARAPAGVAHLPNTCLMLAWTPIADYHESATQAALLQHWRITWGLTLYDQQ